MGNMSYCRFENTAADLRDCLSAIHRGETDDLSSYEIDGLKNLKWKTIKTPWGNPSDQILNFNYKGKEVCF